MYYWILYKSDSGEIYGSPYRGNANHWDNIPEGCAALGPIDTDTATDDVNAAIINPEYYRITYGVLTRKSDTEIQAIDASKTLPRPTEQEVLGQQVAALTLSNGQKDAIIQQLGAQVVQMQLDIAKLKGGVS
ncbi:hypothetical protein [Caproiciproducens galactitolivorans]|uniref:Uncharacterized protein n=1 Tax=Caproiciproducens galactitolivorans TaxID=642589 RepID=A0ABT4BWF2_9FIRM|nr:hypothetical protein [Caproiciproducens galactitolivorans]MCY1715235.1 hypothetical protein [Caproiciproducens galactitolivorans]